MRVSLDSNAWENIFGAETGDGLLIRAAMAAGNLEGFTCDASFRIEAVRKRDRGTYFEQPYLGSRFNGLVVRDGKPFFSMSFGPDDQKHPGLPEAQIAKLKIARAAGVKLIRGEAWMGLPAPPEFSGSDFYVVEDAEAKLARQQRQLDASAMIDARGVGRAAFDTAGGWTTRPTDPAADAKLIKACAEWADGELVAAHIAYQHDILCTNDQARSAGSSVFDLTNRSWLTATFGVTFMTVEELASEVS